MDKNDLDNIMFGLVNHGIKKVVVRYDGGGDSGAIEYINATKDPNIDYDELETWDHDYLLDDIDSELSTLIDDYCHAMLLNDIENWWDDEGGHGYIHINVELCTYKIYNSVKVTEYEEYEHEGSLKDKNKK
jgi:hypothetical protein